MPAMDRRECVLLAEPAGEAERVEPGSVRVTPRIVGIDGRRELHEGLSDALVVTSLGLAHPWHFVADVYAVDESPADLAGIGHVARLDRQAALLHKLAVSG